jgi:hypothetical protein
MLGYGSGKGNIKMLLNDPLASGAPSGPCPIACGGGGMPSGAPPPQAACSEDTRLSEGRGSKGSWGLPGRWSAVCQVRVSQGGRVGFGGHPSATGSEAGVGGDGVGGMGGQV